jgi:hypothetical protein
MDAPENEKGAGSRDRLWVILTIDSMSPGSAYLTILRDMNLAECVCLGRLTPARIST